MSNNKNKEVYFRFLLRALLILIIPVFLLSVAYYNNVSFLKKETYKNNLTVLQSSSKKYKYEEYIAIKQKAYDATYK